VPGRGINEKIIAIYLYEQSWISRQIAGAPFSNKIYWLSNLMPGG
jgi:hypothetical protein